MQFLLSLLGVLLIIQTIIAPYASLAADVKLTPGSNGTPVQVEGTLPATKVGALLATDTVCILSGLTVAIAIQSASGPHEVQVQGHLINNNLTTNGHVGQIQGKAYFDHGPSLKQLGDVRQERVITHDGHAYTGHVVSMDDHAMQFQQDGGPIHNINLQDVKTINSDRSFNFKAELKSDTKMDGKSQFTAQSNKISFTQNNAPTGETKTKVSKTTSNPSNFQKILVITTVALLVATAIAVPVAVGVASHNRHVHKMAQQKANNALQAVLIRRAQLAQVSTVQTSTKAVTLGQRFVLPNTKNPTLPVTPTPVRVLPGSVQTSIPTRGVTSISPVRGTYP